MAVLPMSVIPFERSFEATTELQLREMRSISSSNRLVRFAFFGKSRIFQQMFYDHNLGFDKTFSGFLL
jgi:hypothetical protein